jgi:hypothetical protein
MEIIEWKWSIGKSYEKSQRIYKNKIQHDILSQLDVIKENSAYLQALNEDNTSMFMTNSDHMSNSGSRREDSCYKIAERELISQIGQNPFLNSNYINDITASNEFLKPICTTIEKNELTKPNE